MKILFWLRREYSYPKWLIPPQWVRTVAQTLWAILSCLFGIVVVAVAIPSPFGGLLLVTAGGVALASRTRKVWLDLFVLEGNGAQIFAATWLFAGLVLCAKHFI